MSKYFILLKSLEQGTTQLSMGSNGNSSKIKGIDPDLLKTLKASGFLLLYNLVESTMRNVIESVFDRLKRDGVSYDQIRPELKKIILKNLKNANPDIISKHTAAISVDIITAGFNKEKLFSGNIDQRKIRETASEYGFSYETDYIIGIGNDLLAIKANRNDLAH